MTDAKPLVRILFEVKTEDEISLQYQSAKIINALLELHNMHRMIVYASTREGHVLAGGAAQGVEANGKEKEKAEGETEGEKEKGEEEEKEKDKEKEKEKEEKEKEKKGMEDYIKTSFAILLQGETHMTLVSSPGLVRFFLTRLSETQDQLVFSRLVHMLLVLLKVSFIFGSQKFFIVFFFWHYP